MQVKDYDGKVLAVVQALNKRTSNPLTTKRTPSLPLPPSSAGAGSSGGGGSGGSSGGGGSGDADSGVSNPAASLTSKAPIDDSAFTTFDVEVGASATAAARCCVVLSGASVLSFVV